MLPTTCLAYIDGSCKGKVKLSLCVKKYNAMKMFPVLN
jgi:hypothetical protein